MAKSYFLHQSDAKSNTFKLVLGYIIGLLLVPVLLNVIIILLDDTKDFTTQDHLKLYAITVGVCAVPVLIGSLFYYYKYFVNHDEKEYLYFHFAYYFFYYYLL